MAGSYGVIILKLSQMGFYGVVLNVKKVFF